ncbi:MAG: hypothetical protein F4Z87_05705 [Gammaproteobacteria bacterium]|nr:hypothetical protein [Gammaproteobacteria bacterium]
MKKILVVPLALLSFSVNADERLILGSFERLTGEDEVEQIGYSYEASSDGFGLQYLSFKDSGFYFGAGISFSTGDTEICVQSQCESPESGPSDTTFSGEIGWNFDSWTPFVGLSLINEEIDDESDRFWGFTAGLWFDFDKFKLRGAITGISDSSFLSSTTWMSGGFLYQMKNKWAFGAEVAQEQDSEVNRFSFSLYLGRTI